MFLEKFLPQTIDDKGAGSNRTGSGTKLKPGLFRQIMRHPVTPENVSKLWTREGHPAYSPGNEFCLRIGADHGRFRLVYVVAGSHLGHKIADLVLAIAITWKRAARAAVPVAGSCTTVISKPPRCRHNGMPGCIKPLMWCRSIKAGMTANHGFNRIMPTLPARIRLIIRRGIRHWAVSGQLPVQIMSLGSPPRSGRQKKIIIE